MTALLTASRQRAYRECKRLHHLKYVEGWRPKRSGDALHIGTAVHQGLEVWWQTRGDIEAAVLAVGGAGRDEYQQVVIEEMLRGYDARWGGDIARFEVLAVEAEFRVPLINPSTDRESRTFDLAGKVDGLVRDLSAATETTPGAVKIVEHKTTSDTIDDPAAPYWRKLAMDTQVSQYYMGATALGHEAEGCIYDVLKKPTMRPKKATPVEKRKYKKPPKDDPFMDERDPSLLYANMRAEDESPEEWRARLREDIHSRLEFYFQRREVPRTWDDIKDFLFDTWATAQSMREEINAGRAPRNPDACHRFGECPFWDHCANGLRLEEATDRFQRVASVNPELSLEGALQQ